MNYRIVERIIRVLVYLNCFVPLIFFPQLFIFPYVVPKMLFFRTVTVLAFTLSVALYIAIRQKHAKFMTPIVISIFLFIVSGIISMLFGEDRNLSFWSNQERMLGIFSLFHYVALFFVCKTVFYEKKQWRTLFLVFGGVGIVTVFIGILQKIWPNFLLNAGANRVISTLGNTIYLAGYGLFLFFIGSLLARVEQGKWRIYFLIVALFGLVGVFITSTRGAYLGLLTGLVWVGVVTLLNSQKRKKIGYAIVIIIALFCISIGTLFAFRHSSFVKDTSFLKNISLIESMAEGTGKTRLMAWNVAVVSWKEHPVVGWGPDNFYYAFNKYYNPDFLKFGYQETWFDNAHNVVFNLLTTQGIVGLVTYLSIYAASFYLLYRMKKRGGKENLDIFIFTTGFLVAHFIHNLFVFENITSYFYFFLLLAFIDWASHPQEGLLNRTSQHIPKYALGISFIISLIIIFSSNVNVAMVNIHEHKTRKLLAQGKSQESLSLLDLTKKWKSPYQGDTNWHFASDVLYVLPRVYSYDTAVSRRLYDRALEGMVQYLKVHPKDVRAYLMIMDLLRSGGLVLFDLPVKDQIEEYLQTAQKLSPGRQEIEFAKITYLAGTGKVDESINLAKEMIQKYPSIADSYFTLGKIYTFSKQFKKTLEVIDEARDMGIFWTFSDQQIFAAETYEREGRFKEALFWYDQAYKTTRNERIKYKRDELSGQTQLPVPQKLDDFK